MAQTFKFELVSPEEKLVSEDVGMVTVPGEEGVFGVLAGHSPLLSSLSMGVIDVRREGLNDSGIGTSGPRRIFVAGGFADVGPDHCTVLAEEAVDVAGLDAAALDTDIARLEAELSVSEGFERQKTLARLAVARAKRGFL